MLLPRTPKVYEAATLAGVMEDLAPTPALS